MSSVHSRIYWSPWDVCTTSLNNSRQCVGGKDRLLQPSWHSSDEEDISERRTAEMITTKVTSILHPLIAILWHNNYSQAFIEPQNEATCTLTLSQPASHKLWMMTPPLYYLHPISCEYNCILSNYIHDESDWSVEIARPSRSHHHPPLQLHTIRWERVSC